MSSWSGVLQQLVEHRLAGHPHLTFVRYTKLWFHNETGLRAMLQIDAINADQVRDVVKFADPAASKLLVDDVDVA